MAIDLQPSRVHRPIDVDAMQMKASALDDTVTVPAEPATRRVPERPILRVDDVLPNEVLLRGEWRDDPPHLVLALHGEIDLATASPLDEWLRPTQPQEPLVLDLAGVSFIDATGLSCLVVAHRRRPLRLRGLRPMAWRLLRITGLAEVLLVDEDRSAATTPFSTSPAGLGHRSE